MNPLRGYSEQLNTVDSLLKRLLKKIAKSSSKKKGGIIL